LALRERGSGGLWMTVGAFRRTAVAPGAHMMSLASTPLLGDTHFGETPLETGEVRNSLLATAV
jgi:hypothetical protein